MKQASLSSKLGVHENGPIRERRLAVYHVGLDLGWNESMIHVLDGFGKRVRSQRVRGHWEKLLSVVSAIPRPFAICFEASTGYGWLYDRLVRMARRVEVAHPGDLRLIFKSKRKCDRIDAEKLAKLLYLGAVPRIYVPASDIRSWRSMIEHRTGLICDRTGVKSQVRALLRSQGIRAPRSLWSRKGLAWLRELEFEEPIDAIRRDTFLERLTSLNSMVQRVEKELNRIARGHCGVQLLRTIPGVGPRTAESVVAYIADPNRFQRVGSIGDYFGLVPCMNSSAGKERLGHITKQGPSTPRRMLTEAAWQAVRRSPTVKAKFEKIGKNQPERRKIALVAVAHYLLRAMLAMLKTGEVWREKAA
jgi:transposase